ncbi:MAG: glycoside hydrolase family 1, partial [Opitutaceae bacterium]
SDAVLGREYGYFVGHHGFICFLLVLSQHTEFDPLMEKVYLVGDFNSWEKAVGQAEWEMNVASMGKELVLVWTGPADRFLNPPGQRFKFVTGEHRWLPIPGTSPNATRDADGNLNFAIDPERTGHHLYSFTLPVPIDLSRSWRVEWTKPGGEGAPLRPDGYFFDLKTDLVLGAIAKRDETIFRLFAPRASKVELCLTPSLDAVEQPHRYSLIRRAEPMERLKEAFAPMQPGDTAGIRHVPAPGNWQGVWEVTLDQSLKGWYYWYHVEGPIDAFGFFSRTQKILDPYAFATVGREGPGIIMDRSSLGKANRAAFRTPVWQDLVIGEAHIRDLLRNAPIDLTADERLGFKGLQKYVESPDFYLRRLGVNCVELQPIQENDSQTKQEYHWGYMPVSWFSPASTYASNPADGSAVSEFRDLVEAFHLRGMAVILDVVYNHQGVPAHLMFIDKQYYFATDRDGNLSNWSGCGNDIRASSAMAKRLIIDSCMHMIETFGVDGFRFDLAELLGVDVMRDIERALKTIKRDVILIAEPWSFRGHIAGELADTGWSSWNDGYRDFMRDYIRGGGSASQLEYFLKGSPWYFARWPAQTVNYTESHDDRTWIDRITENGSGSGYEPTALDRRRTHLMIATLFSTLGIPMIAAGQDSLRSKHGVNNTYLRGDLNGVDYRRIQRYSGTHAYMAEWIAFRLGARGRLLRQWSLPSEGFFRSFSREGTTALALLYNSDSSQGPERLLFAINASGADVSLPFDPELVPLPWVQIADHERFCSHGLKGISMPVAQTLELCAYSCALWSA